MGNKILNCQKKQKENDFEFDSDISSIIPFKILSKSSCNNQSSKIVKIQCAVRTLFSRIRIFELLAELKKSFSLSSFYSSTSVADEYYFVLISDEVKEILKKVGDFDQFQSLKYYNPRFFVNSPSVLIQHKEKQFYYRGSWSFSYEKHGRGMLVQDGTVYEGTWFNGKLHGHARVVYADGSFYEGCFKHGLYYGFGKLVCKNQQFKGWWKDGLMDGKGVAYFEDSTVFEGYFISGDIYKGRLILSNGNIQQGLFDSNKELINGTISFFNGDFFEGTSNPFDMKSKGKYEWKNGKIYEGSYENGMKSGKGRYKDCYIDYNGFFSEGKFDGDGKITFVDLQFKVEFSKGTLNSLVPENEVLKSYLQDLNLPQEAFGKVVIVVSPIKAIRKTSTVTFLEEESASTSQRNLSEEFQFTKKETRHSRTKSIFKNKENFVPTIEQDGLNKTFVSDFRNKTVAFKEFTPRRSKFT